MKLKLAVISVSLLLASNIFAMREESWATTKPYWVKDNAVFNDYKEIAKKIMDLNPIQNTGQKNVFKDTSGKFREIDKNAYPFAFVNPQDFNKAIDALTELGALIASTGERSTGSYPWQNFFKAKKGLSREALQDPAFKDLADQITKLLYTANLDPKGTGFNAFTNILSVAKNIPSVGKLIGVEGTGSKGKEPKDINEAIQLASDAAKEVVKASKNKGNSHKAEIQKQIGEVITNW